MVISYSVEISSRIKNDHNSNYDTEIEMNFIEKIDAEEYFKHSYIYAPDVICEYIKNLYEVSDNSGLICHKKIDIEHYTNKHFIRKEKIKKILEQ